MPSGHVRDVGDSQPLQGLMAPGSQTLPVERGDIRLLGSDLHLGSADTVESPHWY